MTIQEEPIRSLDELQKGDLITIDRPGISGLPWVVQSTEYVPKSTREFSVMELTSPRCPNCTYRYYEETLHGVVRFIN